MAGKADAVMMHKQSTGQIKARDDRRFSAVIAFHKTALCLAELEQLIRGSSPPPKRVILHLPDENQVHSPAFEFLRQVHAMDNPAINAVYAHFAKEYLKLAKIQLNWLRRDAYARACAYDKRKGVPRKGPKPLESPRG